MQIVARVVFGLSAALFGIVELLWRNSELWRGLRSVGTPVDAIVAWCVAIALIGGGIGMMFSRTARTGALVIGCIYLLSALSTIPGMVAKPSAYVQYVDFFEKFSVVCGAFVVCAATQAAVARIAMGVCAVSFAWAQIVYFQYTASLVPAWIWPSQAFWTMLTTVAFALAALAMLVNVQAQLAARLMALMLALFGVLVWVPRIAAHPSVPSNWNEIASNYVMTAAVWLVAIASRARAARPAAVAGASAQGVR